MSNSFCVADRFCMHCNAFIDHGPGPGNAGGGAWWSRGTDGLLLGPFCSKRCKEAGKAYHEQVVKASEQLRMQGE